METGTPQRREPNQPVDLEGALATIGRKAIRIEQLEAENASLQAQISTRSQDHTTTGRDNTLISPAPSSQDTGSANVVPKAQYEVLKLQLAELQASHTELQGQHEIIRKKFKESKALVKQWQAYLREKKERDRKGRNPDAVSTPPPPAAIEQRAGNTPGDMDITPRAPTTRLGPDPSELNDKQDGPPEMTSSPPRLTAIPDRSTSQIEPERRSQPIATVTSSQTTVDEPEAPGNVPLHVQDAPSSDFEPIVVSTRCLKRKAGPERGPRSPSRRIKQEPSSPNTPMDFESGSSRRPPEFRIDTTSSDDCLDNFGPAMNTPRRPKRVSDLRLRATSEEVLRPAPQLLRSASSLSDGDVTALVEQPALAVQGSNQAALENEGHLEQRNGFVSSRPSGRQQKDALRPISVNIPRQQRSPRDLDKPRAKIRRTGVKDKILLVSEDGDDGYSQNATHSGHRRGPRSPGLDMDVRLDELLNGPSLNRAPILPQPITAAGVPPRDQTGLSQDQAGPHSRDQTGLPPSQPRPRSAQLRTPVSVVKRTSPVKPTTSLGRTPVHAKLPQSGRPTIAGQSAGRGKSPPPVRPEEEPLRIRPAATLRLEDFKINPNYMGTDFAFADTIRGRDARQNLHACTRADCCGGALEKVIRMGGTAMSGRTDAHALEAFIGPAWQALMGAKRPDEAKKLLQQAHAFCFANEHGKHRQAFERRSTPPGYWRADFPTTQEQAIDRQTAEEMKRKEVEDRHREAMREGGRWIFRDE